MDVNYKYGCNILFMNRRHKRVVGSALQSDKQFDYEEQSFAKKVED